MGSDTRPAAPGHRPGWHTARHYCHQVAAALPAEATPLDQAVARTAACDVVALCGVPHYDSSAMDGWVVRGPAPWQLVDAGRLEPGQAATIATGGLIPGHAHGVLRSEHGHLHSINGVGVLDRNAQAGEDEPHAGEHVRPTGEEVGESDIVITAGTVLNPAHIALAAAAGHDVLQVVRTPQVGLILTGNEVVEAGIPRPGHVRDSFGPQLPALLALLGAAAVSRQRLPDNLDLLTSTIADTDADIIVTTGGTGGSSVDHLHAALRRLKSDTLIDGVAMRPGAPSLLARLDDGRFLVGLPGNPLAAMTGILTLLQPLIAGLSGASEPALGSVVTAQSFKARPGLTRLIPYRLIEGVAAKTQWSGSGMMRGLSEADAILVVAPAGAPEGTSVGSVALPWRTRSRPTPNSTADAMHLDPLGVRRRTHRGLG